MSSRCKFLLGSYLGNLHAWFFLGIGKIEFCLCQRCELRVWFHFTIFYFNLTSVDVKKNGKRFPTIKPGYGNGFKEDEEEKTHPTGRVVIKKLEHVQTTLWEHTHKNTGWKLIPVPLLNKICIMNVDSRLWQEHFVMYIAGRNFFKFWKKNSHVVSNRSPVTPSKHSVYFTDRSVQAAPVWCWRSQWWRRWGRQRRWKISSSSSAPGDIHPLELL